LRVGIYNHFLTPRASKKKHSFHFVKLELVLVFQPEGITILAYQVADFAEKEIASDR